MRLPILSGIDGVALPAFFAVIANDWDIGKLRLNNATDASGPVS